MKIKECLGFGATRQIEVTPAELAADFEPYFYPGENCPDRDAEGNLCGGCNHNPNRNDCADGCRYAALYGYIKK